MPYAPRATLNNPYGPQVSFRTEDVLPPSAYYLSPEDQVTVWLITDVLAQTVFLQLRLLMPTGEIQLIPYQFTPQSTLNWYAAFEVPPWEGYILGAMCWSSNPQRGRCFVSVQVMRSLPPNLQAAGVVLLQGYINSINVLSYPTSQVESTFSGRGAFLTIAPGTITGANLVFPVPQNALWRLCSITFEFTTSATAVTRQLAIAAVDANNVIVGLWESTFQQPQSTGYRYGFSPGGANASAQFWVNIAGPTDLYLPQLSSLQTQVGNIQSGDQFTSIGALVEQWMGA